MASGLPKAIEELSQRYTEENTERHREQIYFFKAQSPPGEGEQTSYAIEELSQRYTEEYTERHREQIYFLKAQFLCLKK